MREELIDFSTEDLMAEIKRREKIASMPWPRVVNVKGYVEIENMPDLEDNLAEYGFEENSSGYNNVIMSLSGIEFSVEIDKDGGSRLAAVNGHSLPDE